MAFFTAIVFDFLGYRGVFTQQGRESIVRFATLRYWLLVRPGFSMPFIGVFLPLVAFVLMRYIGSV